MGWNVDHVIWFYMFICAALLVFNLGYIFRSKGRSRAHTNRTRWWAAQLEKEFSALEAADAVSKAHQELMQRKLSNMQQLLAYNEAVEPILNHPQARKYLDGNHTVFQVLAVEYQKRPAMERAFYAHLMAKLHPAGNGQNDQLVRVLLAYLDDSTVYCRENVLNALCALGSVGGVHRALSRFQAQGWYHHPRLISDGLMNFAGDKAALAARLWSACILWDESLQVAVVQFITGCSGDFGAEILAVLRDETAQIETRFAAVRYFQRWPYAPARPVLQALAGQKTGLAIAACSALAKYPGADTNQILLQALHSRSWYIRRNAAAALVALSVPDEEMEALRSGTDRYAREMYHYMAQLQQREGAKT